MMYSLMREQTVVDVSGTKFGGQPGQYPTVLIGTIFYGKDFRELDKKTYAWAKELIRDQEEISKETYINIMLQYRPMFRAGEFEDLNRKPSTVEFDETVTMARDLGLHRGFEHR